jgi:hypothetical protein
VTGPPLLELLDERLLGGPVEVLCHLGPSFGATLVNAQELSDAASLIEDLCATWGGACHPIYATQPGATEMPGSLLSDLEGSSVDSISGRGLLDESLKSSRNDVMIFPSGGVIGEPLFPVIVAADRPRDDWGEVSVPILEDQDPWQVAYLATVGLLPEAPLHPQALQIYGLRSDVGWEDLIDVTREPVVGDAPDLLRRLRTPATTVPTNLSAILLGLWQAPRNAGIVFSEADRDGELANRTLVGPNICIVYEPGSVEDLALAWNLRAAHGLPRGFPLACPLEHAVEALREWDLPARTNFGIGGDRRPCLVSRSVELEQLNALAEQVGDWRAVPSEQLVQPVGRPGRTSTRLVTFAAGHASIPSWTPEDRIALGSRPSQGRDLQMKCTVAPATRRLPPGRTIRPQWSSMAGYRDWGYQADDPGPDRLLEIEWPSGWAVLQARLADIGLRGEPSPAGRTAANFLTRLGSFEHMQMLLDPLVIEQLHELGTARSLSWFRRRIRDMSKRAGAGEDRLEEIERELAQMRMRPPESEQPDVTVDKLHTLFGGKREIAGRWVRWAESVGVLVRGANIHCPRCRRDSWRSVLEFAPPLICRGCAAAIAEPFPVDQLKFRYRAGEPLLRLIESDAFVHLLAMRYMCTVWESRFGRPAPLFGAYPGVDLFEGDDQVGEADVLLLLADGQLVPGECKQRGAGLNNDEIAKLETVATRLNAPWSFFATADWAADCPSIWRDAIRPADGDEPQRLVFTAEQLLEPMLFNLAVDWQPVDQSVRDERHARYVDGVVRFADYLDVEQAVPGG